MSTPAPILLFTYKRLATLKQTVEALKNNELAAESELFVFSDAAKKETDREQIEEVRSYIRSITGFNKTTIFEAEKNNGLANSIIGGATDIINQYGKVIVLEDDLVTSRNFLSFMNQALDYYEPNKAIFSVAGFSMPIKGVSSRDVYFSQRASSWGWATWKDRWNEVDWKVSDYASFKNDNASRKAFNRMGSDMAGMLDKQMAGKINSWAIRWCYQQYKNNTYTVHPFVSKIKNIGFSEEATHTKERFDRFATKLDDTNITQFHFPDEIEIDRKIISQFVKPYSIPVRIKHKLLNLLPF